MRIVQLLSKMKTNLAKAIDKNPVCTLIVPVMAAILILLNRQGGSFMSKIEVNLIFFILFLFELIIAIASQKNSAKLFWVIGTIASSLEAIIYNFCEEGRHFPLTSIHEILNGFCGIYLIISLPVFIYFIVVCIRVVRWDQADWEKVKAIQREYQKNRIKEHIQLRYIINQYKSDQKKQLLQRHYDMKTLELNNKLNHRNEIKTLRQSQKLKEVQNNQQPFEKILHKIFKFLISFLITSIIIFLYIKIPIKETNDGDYGINKWLQQTEQFMETFQDATQEKDNPGTVQDSTLEEGRPETIQDATRENNNPETIQNTTQEGNNQGTIGALTEYTIFYIALAGTALSVILLIWKTVEGILEWIYKGAPAYTGFSGFISEYSTPFVILIIAVSVLLTMIGYGNIFENLPDLFTTLVATVMCIILTLIAADAIRLIINQSIHSDSLLRTAMHLAFVLIIENVMGIVLGVLTGINLKAVITSLISFFIHPENESLYNNVEKTMDDALNEEIDNIRRRKKHSNSSRFPSRRLHK
ncbi:MAG: hypothetical protein NC313_09690 [Butyrivibrio sp.]|nr:hypothetical protein [Butyrivibrio sp.]